MAILNGQCSNWNRISISENLNIKSTMDNPAYHFTIVYEGWTQENSEINWNYASVVRKNIPKRLVHNNKRLVCKTLYFNKIKQESPAKLPSGTSVKITDTRSNSVEGYEESQLALWDTAMISHKAFRWWFLFRYNRLRNSQTYRVL